MFWSLAEGSWDAWRGIRLFRRCGARGRRRGDRADAPAISRAQQVAPRRIALMRTAVVGVGYLGRFHAQKYAALAGFRTRRRRRSESRGDERRRRGARRCRPRRLSRTAGPRRGGQHRDADADPLPHREGVSGRRRARARREADDRDGRGGRRAHRGARNAPGAFCRSGIWSDSTPRCRRCSRY